MADFDMFGPVDVGGGLQSGSSADSSHGSQYAALALAVCGGFFMGELLDLDGLSSKQGSPVRIPRPVFSF